MNGGPQRPWPRPRPATFEDVYDTLRDTIDVLELTIEQARERDDGSLADKTYKRLDKAVTVMKAGFKIMKKSMRKQNVRGTEVPLRLVK